MNKKNLPVIIFLAFFMVVILLFLFINFWNSDRSIHDNYLNNGVLLNKNIKSSTLNWLGNWYKENEREQLLKEAVTKFEFTHPGIDINLKFPEEIIGDRSPNDMGKLIANMIKTGKYSWDIVWIDADIYNVVASELNDTKWGEKFLVNLEDVPGFLESQKSFLLKDPVYRNQTGGIIVSPFLEGFYMTIWYNSDVARMAGIEIKKSGMLFDDLLMYVAKLQNYNKMTNSNIAPFYEASDWPTLDILFQQLVKSEFDNNEEVKYNILTKDKLLALKKTLVSFEKLSQYDPLIKDFNHNKWSKTMDLILNDKALFYISGTWMHSLWMSLDTLKTKKMIPAELPVFRETNYYLGGYKPTFAILKNAPNWQAGIDLLKLFSTPEVADTWVRYTYDPTGIKGDHFASELYDNKNCTFQEAMFKKYGTNIHYSNDVSYLLGDENKMLTSTLEEELIKILTKQATADEAYQNLINKLNK